MRRQFILLISESNSRQYWIYVERRTRYLQQV
jgi:hypothetical protein